MTFPHWDTRLLQAMGITPTAARLRFLQAWAACEGGTAAFNPMNTTMPVNGSTNFNSVGVKQYPDELAGLAATLLTLRLHFYADIRAALRREHLSALEIAEASAHGLATWGTGSGCILRSLRTR